MHVAFTYGAKPRLFVIGPKRGSMLDRMNWKRRYPQTKELTRTTGEHSGPVKPSHCTVERDKVKSKLFPTLKLKAAAMAVSSEPRSRLDDRNWTLVSLMVLMAASTIKAGPLSTLTYTVHWSNTMEMSGCPAVVNSLGAMATAADRLFVVAARFDLMSSVDRLSTIELAAMPLWTSNSKPCAR
jgi:hypothetical protein